jgi:hypothetical protein
MNSIAIERMQYQHKESNTTWYCLPRTINHSTSVWRSVHNNRIVEITVEHESSKIRGLWIAHIKKGGTIDRYEIEQPPQNIKVTNTYDTIAKCIVSRIKTSIKEVESKKGHSMSMLAVIKAKGTRSVGQVLDIEVER